MRVITKNKEINVIIINKLSIKILEAIKSMIKDYRFLYNVEELALLNKMLSWISSTQNIEVINTIEEQLKSLVFKTWEYEEKQGNNYIHWLKSNKINSNNPIISTTFGNVDSFCNSVIGIKYTTDIRGFIAACKKDAAVVIESKNNKSIYTIKILEDERVVNSYNLSTPIFTPKQTIDSKNNNYKSKHNEIILDAKFATPLEIVCIDDNYIDLAIELSNKYNIPFRKEKSK